MAASGTYGTCLSMRRAGPSDTLRWIRAIGRLVTTSLRRNVPSCDPTPEPAARQGAWVVNVGGVLVTFLAAVALL